MNVLEHHMRGETSAEYRQWCLARHIAHWNSTYRQWWLTTKWQANNGEASTAVLRQQAMDARYELIQERDKKFADTKIAEAAIRDRTVGRAALAVLRGMV